MLDTHKGCMPDRGRAEVSEGCLVYFCLDAGWQGTRFQPGSNDIALDTKEWGWGLSCMDSSGQCRHQDCCEVFFGFWAVVSLKAGLTGCNEG